MPRQATPKLSIASDDFQRIRARKSQSRGVAYGFRSILGRFVRHVGDIHVGSLKPHHLEDFFYGVGGLSDTCSRTTLAKYRNDLKQFIDFCHRRGWTEHTGFFMLGGVDDKSTKPNRDRFRMTRDEIIDLMNAATDPRDRALVAFVANTAVRIGEALSLKVSDLRLSQGEVYVRRHKTREEVTYALTADLEAEMRVWLAIYTSELARKGIKLDPRKHYLFPAKPVAHYQKGKSRCAAQPDGYNPVGNINNPRTIIQPIATKAGIEMESGDGWHTLRRSVARIFFDDACAQGHDAALRLTQALLGHKHAQTTETYLGLDLERRTVDKMMRGKPFIIRDVPEGKVIGLADRKVS